MSFVRDRETEVGFLIEKGTGSVYQKSRVVLGLVKDMWVIVASLMLAFYMCCNWLDVKIEPSMFIEWAISSFLFYRYCISGGERAAHRGGVPLGEAFPSFMMKGFSCFSAMILPIAGSAINGDVTKGALLYVTAFLVLWLSTKPRLWGILYPRFGHWKTHTMSLMVAFAIPIATTGFLVAGLVLIPAYKVLRAALSGYRW